MDGIYAPGVHRLGPDNATLSVHTKRGGAAAKAGHDLELHVTRWEATLDLDAGTAELTADGGSLRVEKGEGGMQKLGDHPARVQLGMAERLGQVGDSARGEPPLFEQRHPVRVRPGREQRGQALAQPRPAARIVGVAEVGVVRHLDHHAGVRTSLFVEMPDQDGVDRALGIQVDNYVLHAGL